MIKRSILGLSLLLLAPFAPSCDTATNSMTVPPKVLRPGGIYVAANNGCAQGCEKVARGDLIQTIDGKEVKTTSDFLAANVTDGQPHKLGVYKQSEKAVQEIEIVAEPGNSLPPIKAAPPFWTVGAAELDKAPPGWARRRLFGHASPQIQLYSVDGGLVTGRDFYGRRQIIVFWDWQTSSQQFDNTVMFQMLQKAQTDLGAKGYGVSFAYVPLPGRESRPAPNDKDMRNQAARAEVKEDDGGPLPWPPMFRYPNATEFQEAQNLGMEGGRTYLESIGESPAIMILDEHGIIRWHSEGTIPDPENPAGQAKDEAQYTMLRALKFALEEM